MNRRDFLKAFGWATVGSLVVPKLEIAEKATSYFFAPASGWRPLALAAPLEFSRLAVYSANGGLAKGFVDVPTADLERYQLGLCGTTIDLSKYNVTEIA